MIIDYKDFKITYKEEKNVWEIEGEDRWATFDSLKSAKARVDNIIEPPERKEKFKRFNAYKAKLWSEDLYEVVEVTSIAGNEAWIKDSSNSRGKEKIGNIYPVNEENTKVIEDIKRQHKFIRTEEEKLKEIRSKLKPMVINA